MRIIIGNQKGGVGKSTICFLLANYFSNVKKEQVMCLDFDPQLTLFTLWEDEMKTFDNEPPYDVLDVDLENGTELMEKLGETKGVYSFIDLPGNLSNDDLIAVYKNCDLIICPFSYDQKTFQSTVVFCKVIREYLKIETPMLFLPNRIKSTVNYSKEIAFMHPMLEPFGTITDRITDRIFLNRQNLFDPNDPAFETNKSLLQYLYKYCIKL